MGAAGVMPMTLTLPAAQKSLRMMAMRRCRVRNKIAAVASLRRTSSST